MSATGTYRGTTTGHKTVGRGRLPDFDGSASHIPRPRPETASSTPNPHTPSSDIGSSTMSAASRQRQNQSKRDEVWSFSLGYVV
ncbi:unnamed protein product [Aspergillus oryzae]|uniref:Unnamed protein product n=2 Tax=Aspergillus oryzae TaxID=5062 RepID=A0AAN4YFU5_ASPOZ|nr:unnamed protein product [Aspergillus oryzae]GMF89158.1 unnamed protein product [Aspergillus oryzae]GMG02919.1 unnamed protein product [Aspergillus oryzae]GMG25786.1 unnamed protein product [Aspergillus oryzae]GMG48870.1 unnamed protein product [Aspergillus oryzae var. brunneus]